jgi:hypothetical protein
MASSAAFLIMKQGARLTDQTTVRLRRRRLPLQYFNDAYPDMTSEYGFKCSFNPTFNQGYQSARGWVSKGYYGLDQGPVVIMTENYRSGFFWNLMRKCPYVSDGLRRAGFTGGWL